MDEQDEPSVLGAGAGHAPMPTKVMRVDALLLGILRDLRICIDAIGDAGDVHSQFDAGYLCAAESIIEVAVTDVERLRAFKAQQAADRLLAAIENGDKA